MRQVLHEEVRYEDDLDEYSANYEVVVAVIYIEP